MAGPTLADTLLANQPALLRYLRARDAGDDAEDRMQELWIRARSVSTNGVDDGLAYLYRMAHNLMLDALRTTRRRQVRELSYRGVAQGGNDDADDRPDAERVLLGRERLRAIERTLGGLGSRTEYIFRRHRIDGVAQRDIADELGITLSAVEKHLQKAYRAVAVAQRSNVENCNDPNNIKEPSDGRR